MKNIIKFLILVIFIIFSNIIYSQNDIITNDIDHNIILDSNGVHSQSNFNYNNLFSKEAWTGDWIWLNKDTYKEYQSTKTEWNQNSLYSNQYKALFRKSFNISELPEVVVLFITADVSYRVYINNEFVAQGPPNIGNDYFDGVPPKHWFYTSHNVSNFLKNGENIIAIEVYSHFLEISETTSGKGLLVCDLEDNNNLNILKTDSSWKCNIDTSFRVNGGNYSNNSNYEIKNWLNTNYDDSKWEYSSTIKLSKEEYLTQSMIPTPMRYPIDPKRIIKQINGEEVVQEVESFYNCNLNSNEYILDFGRNTTAFYGFKIIAHKNDTIKIFPFESKYKSQNRALTYICKEGENIFYAPYLSVFRYLKIQLVSPYGINIQQINTYFSSYPVQYIGKFECSNPTLNELWDITRWTTQLCMNDMFYDSPKHQEPIACTGDYLIESLINYYTFGDQWLTRQTLIKTALMLEKNNYDMFHTSYSLLWVQMIQNYYLYTGDLELIKELLPDINNLNALFEKYLDNDYLVSNAPDYMFMDWIKIGNFNAHHPPAVIGMGYMTAFYYKSLTDAAYLNSIVGNDSIEVKQRELAKNIKNGINKLLWDPEKKLYKDGIPFRNSRPNHYFFPKDTNITTYSPHVNTLAVLYDIAPKNLQSGIIDYIINQEEIDLQPYFSYFVLSALEHTGLFDSLGLHFIQKWENGINKETYTLKENWQDETVTGYKGDYSHAWGGSPLYFMSKNILGVQPLKPGFKEIKIVAFIQNNIDWAKGRIPLMQNKYLDIQWEKQNSNTYIYKLDIPDGYVAFLIVPEKYRKNGYLINNQRYSSSDSEILILRGTYKIEILK